MSSVPVYVGRWQDYSRGQVLGDTLTLNVRWGGYLIAALSTFIGLVGTAFWAIIAFVVHQLRARDTANDGVFFQHQIIYRNQGTALGALTDLCLVCWNWRKKKSTGRRVSGLKQRTVYRSLPPIIIFLAFTATGVFVSEVAGPAYLSNNVRVKAARCGYWAFDTTSEDGYFAESHKSVNDTQAGRQYSRSCYHSDSISTNCGLYPMQMVPYNSSMVPCPFLNDPTGHELCKPSGNKALQMDTGYLDTNNLFGINAASQDRLLFRNVVTCSPIRANAYLNTSNTDASGYTLWQFNMGGITKVTPYTYIYDTRTITDVASYQILPLVAFDGDQAWQPVAALDVPNADISIHFLAQNSVSYASPVYDIWFSATQFSNGSGNGLTLTTYEPDLKVSVMACTDQYQICNPGSSPFTCTIVGSELDLNLSISQIGLNSYQAATAQRFMRLLAWTSTFETVFDLGSQALLAHDLVRLSTSPGLPEDQWQLEARGWFETSLAKLQDYIVQFAVNTADLGKYGYVMAPDPEGNPEQQALLHFCGNQRIRNTGGYRSFSFLGLMIVICLGTTILVLSWILEPLVAFVRGVKGPRKHDYREVARVADRKLQLHRKALVSAGYDKIWLQTMDDIPITTLGSQLPPATRQSAPNATDYHYFAHAATLTGTGTVPAMVIPSTTAAVPDSQAQIQTQRPEMRSLDTSEMPLTGDHRTSGESGNPDGHEAVSGE